MAEKTDRRGFLNASLLGAAGMAATVAVNSDSSLAAVEEETGKPKQRTTEIAPGSLQCGKIGDVSISRLFIGCNLISGTSHGRDLVYLSRLFKAYNSEAKIFETLEMAQACGINTMLVSPGIWAPVLKYNKQRTQKLQTMVNFEAMADKTKTNDEIKRRIDKGATLLYSHGMATDELTMADKIDVIGQAIDLVKAQGVPVGVGSHSLETTIACEKHKLNPDYYVKTFHSDRYWSATPKANRQQWCWYSRSSGGHDSYHDNMWCIDPERTAEFMETVGKPWVAFKVMAAGAIPPRMAFSHAYRHGADFIVAGMFDFQVEDDVKIAIESVQKTASRKRPWRG